MAPNATLGPLCTALRQLEQAVARHGELRPHQRHRLLRDLLPRLQDLADPPTAQEEDEFVVLTVDTHTDDLLELPVTALLQNALASRSRDP